jgi:hypothetical protein
VPAYKGPSPYSMTLAKAREVFHHDPETGHLFWKINSQRARAGNRITNRTTRYNYVYYQVSHIVWLLNTGKFPEQEIDHINGDWRDNRMSNLREATHSQNMANMQKKDKYVGIYYLPQIRKWEAKIMKDYKSITVGYYDTKEEAYEARKAKARELFPEFSVYGEE